MKGEEKPDFDLLTMTPEEIIKIVDGSVKIKKHYKVAKPPKREHT